MEEFRDFNLAKFYDKLLNWSDDESLQWLQHRMKVHLEEGVIWDIFSLANSGYSMSIKNVAKISRSEQSADSISCSMSNGDAEKTSGDTEKRLLLANKLAMLQKEERALKSFLAELRTQHAKLTIENMRLGKISEKRKDEVMSDENEAEGYEGS